MKKEQVMKTLRAYSMVIVLVVIAVLFHLLTNGLIFTAMNLTNIILQNSYVVLLILGMLPVILTGNVDLSVGSAGLRRRHRRHPAGQLPLRRSGHAVGLSAGRHSDRLLAGHVDCLF